MKKVKNGLYSFTFLVAIALLIMGMVLVFENRLQTGWPTKAEKNSGAPAADKSATPEALSENWPRFRGVAGAGATDIIDIPTRWNGATGEGILWKTPVPLPGHNSPVVWRDYIFLSGANWEKREVYCIDAKNGSIIWTGKVPTTPVGNQFPDVMEDTGLAACTVAVDGVRVYAIFATGDLAAFDFGGRLLWHKSLGIPENTYGHAASLEVWRDHVLVQYDQAFVEDGKSRLYAFDGATGSVAWETKRPVSNSWTTPVIALVGGGYQLITAAAPWVIAYNPEDGKEIWRAKCLEGDAAPSPVLSGDLTIAVDPHHQTVAIRTDGAGDVTDTHVLWRNNAVGPEIASPAADDRHVFLTDTYGTLYAINSKNGELLYEYDFDKNVTSSPSLVAGKLYVLDLSGTMYIGMAGETEFKLETKNTLDEQCYASPAFMPGRIYIRGTTHLYCIGNTTH